MCSVVTIYTLVNTVRTSFNYFATALKTKCNQQSIEIKLSIKSPKSKVELWLMGCFPDSKDRGNQE